MGLFVPQLPVVRFRYFGRRVLTGLDPLSLVHPVSGTPSLTVFESDGLDPEEKSSYLDLPFLVSDNRHPFQVDLTVTIECNNTIILYNCLSLFGQSFREVGLPLTLNQSTDK